MNRFAVLVFVYIIFSINHLYANEKIVFVDIDKIIYESDLGKKIANQMDSDFKKEESKLKKIEETLLKREADIVKQKNILSKEELDKKVISLRKEITEFKKEKNSLFNKFQQQKLQKVNKMVDKLNKILSQYAANKYIDIIVQKKNIVIGKSELDITDAIMKVFNKQVKSL